MPTPKLIITIRNSVFYIDRLRKYRIDSSTLEAKYQHFIAEMIMLRLFSIFEHSVSEIAFKIASGAIYLNGKTPVLASQAGSIVGARSLFLNYGRRSPRQNLQWTKSKYIRESVEHVISTTDPFINASNRNGIIIDEMRKIRNILAHSSKKAREDYKSLIRITYGANLNITPGAFLSSTKRSHICNLERYLGLTKIILQDMASGT
jgi:hypothetical protein